jgi:hypothetical protein
MKNLSYLRLVSTDESLLLQERLYLARAQVFRRPADTSGRALVVLPSGSTGPYRANDLGHFQHPKQNMKKAFGFHHAVTPFRRFFSFLGKLRPWTSSPKQSACPERDEPA